MTSGTSRLVQRLDPPPTCDWAGGTAALNKTRNRTSRQPSPQIVFGNGFPEGESIAKLSRFITYARDSLAVQSSLAAAQRTFADPTPCHHEEADARGFQRERLELSDGDFLDLDWLSAVSERVAILCHGLEGSSSDATVCGMSRALQASGWNVLAWNYRGCSGELNRLPRLYHSGETADLARVVEHAARRFSCTSP